MDQVDFVNDSLMQTPGPLTRELLEYWIHHPEALGTLEAIVEWWLLEHRIQHVAGELRSVLSDLVGNGFVVPRHEADGRTYYRLNREKEAEILSWLQAKPCGLDRVSQTSKAKEKMETQP